MCGIIGYLGSRDATSILIDGLRRLEYRGYDSAGVAVLERTGVQSVVKRAARVETLVEALQERMPEGRLGIGHTRWATHGRPTQVNAHPHTDCRGRISVVHNGIIENFEELRAELRRAGHRFASDTDTEVVPHLIEEYYRGDFLAAVRQALARIRGAYALVMFCLDDPELLVGARLNAPLVVGLGEGEYFIASDIAALLPYTRKVLVLGEGEIAAVTPLGASVTALDGMPAPTRVLHVSWDTEQAERGGHPHFMLKEIMETPEAAANALRGRLDDQGRVHFAELELPDERLQGLAEVRLLGMGTSRHAAMVGEQLIEAWAGLPARAQDASEFRYRPALVGPDTLVVAVTQSGETADTIVALRQARQQESATVAVTNVVGSTIAREADGVIYLHSGPEIGVASTKTLVAHLVSLGLLALRLGELRGVADRRQGLVRELRELPALIRQVLDDGPRLAELARRYAGYRNFLFVGRGLGHPVALEGALKLKEISYLHAEGTSGGELKHGPIALLDRDTPVVAVCTEGPSWEKLLNNVHEVAVRGAPVLALVPRGERALADVATDVLELPRSGELGSAVLATVALQLFAYHVAVGLGRDVDRPRNLAKSVTVE